MSLQNLYPKSPAQAAAHNTETSGSFRSEVKNVVLAIVAFLFVYLLMVAFSVLLFWLCIKLGLMIIMLRIHWVTILFGGGLMVMGVLVVYFLVKFLFATSQKDESGILVNPEEEPLLFEFIHKVADEVGAAYPRKVYLLPDVNASVFYNSNFWSMILPTRKNLNIGLGLVNGLNLSQFKAVLAHEFGHFSQKSMSLGSYVYYVNQVIFNMLYRNDSWASTANGLASIHEIMYFFVQMAVYIVQMVQNILQKMYGFINRRYMSLSREMEFHADAIAAGTSGSNNAIQALRQAEFTAATFQQTIEYCNDLLQEKKAPANAYKGQRTVAAYLAERFELPMRQELPLVTTEVIESRPRQRVSYKDQWASHPTRQEREASLNAINLQGEELEASAWKLFQHAEKWQEQLTWHLYRNVDMELEKISSETFQANILEDFRKSAFPKAFKNYFDNHIFQVANWSQLESETYAKDSSQEERLAFFQENYDTKIEALQQDLNLLEAINSGQIDTRSFDFDGQKYQMEQAFEIRKQVEAELNVLLEARNRCDTEIISTYWAYAQFRGPGPASEFREAMQRMYEIDQIHQQFALYGREIFITIDMIAMNDFNLATDAAPRFQAMKNEQLPAMRHFFQNLPSLELFSEAGKQLITKVFLNEAVSYNQGSILHRQNLEDLRAAIHEVNQVLSEHYQERRKNLLNKIAALTQ